MKHLLLVLFLALSALPALANEEIDAIFADWTGNRPGGTVGVIHRDKLVFSKGYGMADLGRQIPNTPQTVYDLASVSKQFCAVAVLMLAQEDKLSLDDSLGEYLPGLPRYAATTPLKNLLGMTSGFPDYAEELEVSLKELVTELHDEGQSFKAGTQYEYLNMNYGLLTYVVEKVRGKPLRQVLESTIFKPLGMTHTVFLERRGQRIPNRAVGYVQNQGRWRVSIKDAPGVADGNVFSSVDDLSLWVRDLLRGSSVLESAWLKKAWTRGRAGGALTNYGYGFEIDKYQGYTRISHDGSWYGASTYLALYPELKLGVIVLSNREEEDCQELGELVEDLYLP